MQNFKNKVVVVTGAAGGIGRALAEAFLGEGAKVVLADIEEESLLVTRSDLQSVAPDVEAVVTDVSKPDQVERLAAEAYRLFGRVDVLCNNAGITYGGPATWESTLEDWQWVLGVNLMGAVHGLRSFVPRMLCQGDEAVIVNTVPARCLDKPRGGNFPFHRLPCPLRGAFNPRAFLSRSPFQQIIMTFLCIHS